VLPGPVDAMDVVVDLVADLSPQDPFNFLLDPDAASWPFRYDSLTADDLGQFRRADHAGPLLQALRDETASSASTISLILELTHRVRDRVAYIVRMEPGVWNPDRTLAEARGSCRDSAWLLIQLLRMHGIAARFVSGYLIQLPDDGTPDVADLHAWAEAFLPGAGWIGLDATSGLLTAEGHLPLAASPHPISAAPITGTVEPSGVVLETDMQLRRIEAPQSA
jgi:transglutaminase-like putative cysteine protease